MTIMTIAASSRRSQMEEWDKLRITGCPHIDRNTISIYDLLEITFDDFCPEDTVFFLSCYELRNVSFQVLKLDSFYPIFNPLSSIHAAVQKPD